VAVAVAVAVAVGSRQSAVGSEESVEC